MPNDQELKATRVLEIMIESASAKIANTPPEDKPEDWELDFWSGSIPVRQTYGMPIADSTPQSMMDIPQHVMDFYNKKNS